MNSMTLGAYYPGESIIHKLDPRVKIFLTVCLMVIVFLIKSFTGYAIMGAFIILVVLLSGVPPKLFIKSIRPLLFLLIFTFLINLFFVKDGSIIFELGFIKIYDGGVRFSLFMAFRLIFMVVSASVMTLTTTPIMLSRGIERLISPLKIVKFPVHEMSMMMSIALRFIPTLIEETEKIKKAQMARGADFETGGLKKRAAALIPLLIPLFISAFRRADDLAVAMEARCYHGAEGRTCYRVFKMGMTDYIAVLSVLALGVCIVMIG